MSSNLRPPAVRLSVAPHSVRRTALLCLAALALLTSCLPRQAQNTLPECPEPEQNCRPGVWSGEDYAGIPSYGEPGIYHRLDYLASVNSPADEFALSFTGRGVFMTVEEAGIQTLHSVTAVSATELTPVAQIYFEELTMAGAITGGTGTALLAGTASGAQRGDADLYACEPAQTSIRTLGALAAPVSLPLYWDSHPALSPAGDVLFFSSDRPGGYGGTDIWFSVRTAGAWSEPRNCGPAVNSTCDELTPFVTADGEHLLFASSGHTTVGGYDLFVAAIRPDFYSAVRNTADVSANTRLGAALNLGTPVNTADDELFPSSPARYDTLLYFSSNRRAPATTAAADTGGFDLYALHLVPRRADMAATDTTRVRRQQTSRTEQPATRTDTIAATEPLPDHRVTVRGRVTERGTFRPVDSASVTVRELPDNTILDRTFTDSAGRFSVQVPVEREVEISAQGRQLFYDAERLRLERNDTTTVLLRDFSLPGDLSLRINFPTDEYNNPYPYLLDSNGLPTSQTWQEALDLLAENLKVYDDHIRRLILTGHTDDVASDAYNMALGMRRARFVINELVQRGVPASKLEARSAGERRMPPRRDGEPLDLYRARSRRVELQKEMSFILPGTD